MTTAAEVSVKSINIPDTNDVVELYLVDCSGREMYMEGLASHVWSQIDMLVVVYDVTREDTFDAAQKVGSLKFTSFNIHFYNYNCSKPPLNYCKHFSVGRECEIRQSKR